MGNPAAGGSSGAIACLCVPMLPKEAFERWGVALRDAWTVYVEVVDATHFSPLAEITFNGLKFYQQGDVEMHLNGDAADCALVAMTKLQYPEAG